MTAGLILAAVAAECGLLLTSGNLYGYGAVLGLLSGLCVLVFWVYRGWRSLNRAGIYVITFTLFFPWMVPVQGRPSISITTLLIFLLMGLWLLRSGLERAGGIRRPQGIHWIPLVLLANAGISFVFHPAYAGQSLRLLLGFAGGVFLYYLVLEAIDEREMPRFIRWVLILLCVQAVLCGLQSGSDAWLRALTPGDVVNSNFKAGYYRHGVRASGTVWDYELMSEWFLVGCVLSLGMIYQDRRRHYYYMVSLGLYLAGIIFTQTRSVLIVLALVLPCLFGWLVWCGRDRERLSVQLLVAGVILAGAAGLIFQEQMSLYLNRFRDFFQAAQPLSSRAINREETWQAGWQQFLSQPTWLGQGLFSHFSYRRSIAINYHSLYLTILVKFGIVGLLLHVILFAGLLRAGWQRLSRQPDLPEWHLIYFLMFSLVALLINEIKIEYLRHGHTLQFVWLILALTARAGLGNRSVFTPGATCGLRARGVGETVAPPTRLHNP